jgi:glycosyltransferase involved in cell wall biosynthesis
MKTIAYVSPFRGGHHQTYARLYTRTMLELGYRVAAFTCEPGELFNWLAREVPNLVKNLRVIDMQYQRNWPPLGPLAAWWAKVSWVRFVVRYIRAAGVRPDLLFHAWLDNCVTPGLSAGLIDHLVDGQWTGLYFHPWYLRQNVKFGGLRRGPLATHAALRSQHCPAVAVLDEGIADKLQLALKGKPVITFPDIADGSAPDVTYPPAARIREAASSRKVVALLGALSKRKGMLTLLDVARQTDPGRWFFVFAGEWVKASFLPEEQETILQFVGSSPSNCLFHFEYIPDEACFNALVNACDILFAVYRGFASSSNLLTKAAIFERPILVSDAFCMGERVRNFGLGLTVDERSLPSCVQALNQLGQQLERYGQLPGARFQEYRELHSIERLREAFKAVLTAANL